MLCVVNEVAGTTLVVRIPLENIELRFVRTTADARATITPGLAREPREQGLLWGSRGVLLLLLLLLLRPRAVLVVVTAREGH